MDKIQQEKKINEFLSEAEKIREKEYNKLSSQGILIPDYVGGPLCDEWLNEIYIFGNRYLTNHPLFNKIKDIYENKSARYSTFDDMLSILKSLKNDEEYWALNNNYDGNELLYTNNQNINKGSSYSIFISHRTTDKDIADILVNFLVSIGVPFNNIFCSSLPGNDVKEHISNEINEALKKSVCNIVLLSKAYYQSAYCMNECGIIWYQNTLNVPVIPIGLRNMSFNDMVGFLDQNYKLRMLNNDDDLDYIYDTLQKIGVVTSSTRQEISRAINTLKERYNNIISSSFKVEVSDKVNKDDIVYTTDDEKILIYYISTQKKRKFSKTDFEKWIIDNELFNIDITNAIDLISKIGDNRINNECLDLNIDFFKSLTTKNLDDNSQFSVAFKNHQILAKNTLVNLIKEDKLNDELILFIAYMKEENQNSFGDRWLADKQVDDIKQWEFDNTLNSVLSSNYANCLSFFIRYNILYPSDFTSYGNPRQYTLYKSVSKWLFGKSFEYDELLKATKDKYKKQNDDFELPF